jgi:carboxymethylenebutenolidase
LSCDRARSVPSDGSGFEGSYTDFPAATPHLQAITVPGIEADVRAAYGWLEGAGVAGNAAAVGYCFGGRVAFVANTTVPLKAAASYYGGNIPPLLGRAGRLAGRMLFFWGGLDHHIPDEQRAPWSRPSATPASRSSTFAFGRGSGFCDVRASYQPPRPRRRGASRTLFRCVLSAERQNEKRAGLFPPSLSLT